jgi:DNA-binding transcriptional ArsR family regulator
MVLVRRDAFQAIADSNRRAIIGLLAGRELTLSQVAESFQISRPAISKHMKILVECGLVDIRHVGRERVCHLRLDKLKDIADWLGKYQSCR